MWKMAISELSQRPIHKGQKLLFMGSIKGVIQNIYWQGQTVRSAYFAASTKPIFRSESARFVIFIQMSKEMWDFDNEGSGEIMFNKVINGFLPDLFKRWTKLKARHLVTIVLFCRVDYQITDPSTYITTNASKSALKAHSSKYETRDFYRVVVSETLSDDWVSILGGLKREFLVFLRDVSIIRNPFYDNNTLPDNEKEVPEYIIAGRPSASPDSNILEAINLASSQFSRNYIDQDLVRTGISVVVISAGSGIYNVDYNLFKVTTDSLLANGIGVDLVCLSNVPLHSVPLFRYRDPRNITHSEDAAVDRSEENTPKQKSSAINDILQGSARNPEQSSGQRPQIINSSYRSLRTKEWKYAMPYWIDVSYWKYSSEELKKRSYLTGTRNDLSFLSGRERDFIPRCRMYDLQMMGLMETDVNEISIPFLHENKNYEYQESQRRVGLPKDAAELKLQKLRRQVGHGSPKRKDSSWTNGYDAEVFRPCYLMHKSEKDKSSLLNEKRSNTTYRGRADSSLMSSSQDGRQQMTNSYENLSGAPFLDGRMSEKYMNVGGQVSRRESISSGVSLKDGKRNHSSILNRHLSSDHRQSGMQKAVASSELISHSFVTTDFNKTAQTAVSISSSSVSSQIREVLSRQPSQQRLASSAASKPNDYAEKKPSQPIDIQKSSFLNNANRPRTGRVDRSNTNNLNVFRDAENKEILNGVSITKQAGTKPSLLAGGTFSQNINTASPKKEDLPWLLIDNPSNPHALRHKSGNHFHRWQHVFARQPQASTTKWKSLCSPAAVPLTNEFFPSRDQLATEYHESPYKIVQNEDDDLVDNYVCSHPLMLELVAFRLSHGFQLAIGESVSNLAPKVQNVFPSENSCQAGDVVFMSAGNTMHQLLCISNGEVEVRRYTRKISDNHGDRYLSNVSLLYKPYIKSASGTTYVERDITFTSTVEEYNWNYIDNYLAGYRDDFSDNLRFSRTRFVLIPLEVPSLPRETLEETQLDGIRQLTQLWQKHRYLSDDERRLQIISRKKKDPNPLAIDFQTRDPSDIVAAAIANNYNVLSLPEKEPSFFSHITDESGSYHTDHYDLRKLATDLQESKGIKMVDRRWHLTLHHNCFVGSDLATWLLHNFDDIEIRDQAVGLGNRLMSEGLFQHVTKRHQFKDGNYFYQIASEYRLPRPETTSRWFGSRKSPSNPTNEMRSDSVESVEPRTRSSTDTSDNSGAKTPTKRSAGIDRFVLSRRMKYDVDHKKKSYRPEIINLHYDLLHNPANCYHLRIDWMNVTAKLIEDVVASWTATAEKYHLNLVEVPISEAANINRDQPFRSPYHIELAVVPPTSEVGHGVDSKVESSSHVDQHYYQKRILQEQLFVLDFEAASSFPDTADVTYSWGKPDYQFTQYVHQTGSVLAQITDEGNFLVLANRLCRIQAESFKEATRYSKNDQNTSRSVSGATERAFPASLPQVDPAKSQLQNQGVSSTSNYKKLPLSAEQIIRKLDAFCQDEDGLKRFYEEKAKALEEYRVRLATQSTTSSPAPRSMHKSKGLESIHGLSLDTPPSELASKASSSPSISTLD